MEWNLYYSFSAKIKTYLIIIFTIFSFCICSSFDRIQKKEFISDPPSKTAFDSHEVLQIPENDYKYRFSRDQKIRVFVLEYLLPVQVPGGMEKYFQAEIDSIFESNSEITVYRNAKYSNLNEVQKYSLLKELEIDAIIETKILFQNQKYNIIQNLLDPVHKNLLGKIENSLLVKEHLDENQDQVKIYRSSNTYDFLHSQKSPYLQWIKKLSQKEIFDSVKVCIESEISFFSRSIQSSLQCDGKDLGYLPIRSIKLIEGYHECVLSERNAPKIVKKFIVRAGQKKEIYFDSDTLFSSLKIVSIPPGMGVQNLEENLGFTPISLNGLKPKNFSFHFYKFISSEIQEILFSASIPVLKSEKKEIVLPFYIENAFYEINHEFWSKISTGLFYWEMDNHLSFINHSGESIKDWTGIISKEIIPRDLEVMGEFYLPEHTGEGIFQIGMIQSEKIFCFEVEVDRISIFEFRDPLSKGDFVFHTDDSVKSRKFSFRIDMAKERIVYSLEGREVYTSSISIDENLQIYISCKGNIFNRLNLLKSLSVEYLEYFSKKEKNSWKRNLP